MIAFIVSLVWSFFPVATIAALTYIVVSKLPWSATVIAPVSIAIAVGGIVNTWIIVIRQERASKKALFRTKAREFVDRCRAFTNAYIDFAESLEHKGFYPIEVLKMKLDTIGRESLVLELLIGELTGEKSMLTGKVKYLAERMQQLFKDYCSGNVYPDPGTQRPRIAISGPAFAQYQSEVFTAARNLMIEMEVVAVPDRFTGTPIDINKDSRKP
ncbi:MAG: hypothetical protein ABSG17_06455 [Spirochaetia bacterium]